MWLAVMGWPGRQFMGGYVATRLMHWLGWWAGPSNLIGIRIRCLAEVLEIHEEHALFSPCSSHRRLARAVGTGNDLSLMQPRMCHSMADCYWSFSTRASPDLGPKADLLSCGGDEIED